MQCSWVVVVTGCAAAAPHLIATPVTRHLPCVDVAVHPHAQGDQDHGRVLRVIYEVANHCEHAVTIDFGAAVADVVLTDGRHERLAPVAVEHGVALAAELDLDDREAELIGYAAPGVIAAACVDASKLVANAPAVAPVCMRPIDDVYVVVDARDPDHARNAPIIDEHPTQRTVKTMWTEDGTFSVTDAGLTYDPEEFATWRRRPPVGGGFGLSTHHFDLGHRSMHVIDAAGAHHVVSARALGSAQVESVDWDFLGVYLGPFFLSGEFQWAPVGGALANSQDTIASAANMYGGGLIGGVELPRLGPIGGRLEVYTGGAKLELNADAVTTPNSADDSLPYVTTWVVEPRVRVHGWLSPWTTLDAWGGYGVGPSRGDWSIGLALSGHLRGYNGRP